MDSLSCPALATGHLTVTGMRSSDSERAIVGGLGGVSHKVFPSVSGCCLGAFASSAKPGRKPGALLGFTHPLELQRGGGCKVRVWAFSGWHKDFSLPIPRFRPLVQLKVSLDELESRIVEFSPDASELTPWVEVVVEGAIFGDELSIVFASLLRNTKSSRLSASRRRTRRAGRSGGWRGL